MEDSLTVALETIQKGKQAIIFAPSRSSAEKTAEELAKLQPGQFPELEQEILHALSSPTKQCTRLAGCVRKGIAFHHAGLVQKQRECIEQNFRAGKIKVICATPTLAAGLSMPAFRVIIKSLKRFSGGWGMDWIPVLEYLQMAGRAGRPEYEAWGEAIAIAKDEREKEEIYEKYVCGVPEEIYSKLAAEPVLRTYVLSLVSSGVVRDEASLNSFFAGTFWAHQFQDTEKLAVIMQKMLGLLREWKFIEEKDDFVSAGTMHDNPIRATLLGKRVSELYLDPLTARHLLDSLQQYEQSPGTPFSLLQMIAHTLEMRPLLRIRSKEREKIEGELEKKYSLLLEKEPIPYDLEHEEFMNSIKTALFLEAWTEENNEEYLLETYDIRPGEIRGKLEIAEWLLYSCRELAQSRQYRQSVKDVHRLTLRVKYGVKEELLPLLKVKGIGRIRARKLWNQGIKDVGGLNKADLTTLSQLLGKAVAESVKKQLGDEVQEVPEGTRKGQLSLMKY